MPRKHTSSDPALETSVAILREGMGPAVSNAFVIAPLWVPDVGSIGVIAFADLPYARPTVTRRRRRAKKTGCRNQAGEKLATSRADPGHRYAVGAGVVELARRIGLALGAAVFRVRKRALVASIRVGSGIRTEDGDGSATQPTPASPSPELSGRRGMAGDRGRM